MINTIVVDLTPILPGGENGGGKIFTLELIRRLADIHRETKFILLTQAASHDELAIMDRANIRRLMVLGSQETKTIASLHSGWTVWIVSRLPGRVKGKLRRIYHLLKKLFRPKHPGSILKRMGANLLYCPFTDPTYSEKGIPTVCTIYDLQYKTYPQFFSEEEVAHRDRTFAEACHKATVLVAISNYSRDSAITHGGLDPKQVKTIYLQLASRVCDKVINDVSLLDHLGLISQNYLIYPANFWKHKNHEMLLTAFALACQKGLDPNIKLICTGAPGDRQLWLSKASRSMNLTDRILFPGYVSDTELSALMSNCIGVIFPSLYEGFGIPTIEAMASGVPVACSNTTSLPEVVGDAALLFDPRVPDQIAQAIISLVTDGKLRFRLVQAGYLRAKEFSDGDRMAREYWDLFREP